MKVICTYPGNQGSPYPVQVGSTYTVVDYMYGWELMHPKSADMFYQLEEMPDDQRYWCGLFSEIVECRSEVYELLNSEQEPERSVATMPNSSNGPDKIPDNK